MKYRALFVGGPVDGQERVLDSLCTTIDVPGLVYTLRYSYACGEVQTLIYSVFESAETFDRLWSRYAGEDHVPHW